MAKNRLGLNKKKMGKVWVALMSIPLMMITLGAYGVVVEAFPIRGPWGLIFFGIVLFMVFAYFGLINKGKKN